MDADPCDYYQAYFACHSSCPCGLASVRGVAETAMATIAAGALDCAAVVPTCDDAALGGGGVVEVTLFSEAQLGVRYLARSLAVFSPRLSGAVFQRVR